MARFFKRKWRFDVVGIRSEELDLSFKVQKSLRHEPNSCSLTVYGLSSRHRETIESLNTYDPKTDTKKPGEARKKRATGRQPKTGKIPVSLWAGYEDTGLGLIFSGELRRGIATIDRPDTMLEVEGEDGGTSFIESRINETFPPGTSRMDVIDACLEAMGLGKGNHLAAMASTLGKRTYAHGTSLSGQASELLKELLRSEGFTYSIQNGVIQIVRAGQGLAVSAYPLSSSTGLIGNPERDSTGAVTVRTLMIADVYPGSYIQLNSITSLQGLYYVKSMLTEGDSSGSAWGHTLELHRG